MSDTFYNLTQRISDAFDEMDSDIVTDLADNNEEYAALRQQLGDLKKQHSFIDKVIEGSGELALTAEQHGALTEYFRLYLKADSMEREQIYFRGHTDNFAYLKKIGAI